MIKEKVDYILEKNGIEKKLPMIFDTLLDTYNITCLEYDDNDIDFMSKAKSLVCYRNDVNTDEILLSIYKHNPRKTYNMLHGLGHIILHLGKYKNEFGCFYGKPYTKLEHEADMFADEMLLPEELIRHYHDKIGPDLEALRKKFNVDSNLIYSRLKKLGLDAY